MKNIFLTGLALFTLATLIPVRGGGSAGWWDIGWNTDYIECSQNIGDEICVGEKRHCTRTVNLQTCFESNLCFIEYCYTPGGGNAGGGGGGSGTEGDCAINPLCYLAT